MGEQFGELLETIDSPEFDVLNCIDYLRRYSNNIGVHHHLTSKLRSFNADDIEFFIPQLIQLMVSFETDSMALEEFLLEYANRFPHFSLIVFWNVQAYIFELRKEPESYSFHIVRLFINKLQDIIFNTEIPEDTDTEFRENLYPSLIFSGALAASFGMPKVNGYALPLVKTQAKQQKSFVFKLANFQKALTRNLTMKNQRIVSQSDLAKDDSLVPTESSRLEFNTRSPRRSENFFSDESEFHTTDDDENTDISMVRKHRSLELRKTSATYSREVMSDVEDQLKINTKIKSKKSFTRQNNKNVAKSKVYLDYNNNTHSLPDLNHLKEDTESFRPYSSPNDSDSSINSLSVRVNYKLVRPATRNSEKTLSYAHLSKILKVNYSRKETEFIMALQNISLRLSQVPKEARLSALRAELSIINENLLPSEIDIPQLLPITSNKNKKYHKILRLSINEACVLNSAERVPYLLFVEYLSDELDFNPFNEVNQKIIKAKANSTDAKFKDVQREAIKIAETNDDSITATHKQASEPHANIAEADLSDLNIISRKSSGHDLSKLKLLESNFDQLRNETNASKTSSDMSTKADQMRIASVMLQQLENSGQSTSEQTSAIRSRIVESMISLQDQFDSINYDKFNQLRRGSQDAGARKLENDFKLAEDWHAKRLRIKNSSIYGHLDNWDLCSVIVKNGDDLPQEAFACQLISMISNIWRKNNIPFWTKRMKILITSANSGLVETITNAISIHSIKKSLTEILISKGENAKGRIFTLQDYFVKIHGNPNSARFRQAQDNFAKSLASYSIICYLLQIKDRHNGNIMLDNEGHIIHIDFGFLLSNSPGSVGFEAAPFKLTTEYVDLMGGVDGPAYQKFKNICKHCFRALRKNGDQIVNMVELMQKESNLPCFQNGENTSVLLKQRLQLQLSEQECDNFVENTLIAKSLGSMYTRLYDQFQMVTQGIYS